MMLVKFEFTQLTPWFFKANTTFEKGTWGYTHKLPPISTLIGAMRSALGKLLKVDWEKYRSGKSSDIERVIGKYGTQEELPFVVYGPFVGKGNDVYFPLSAILKVYEISKDGQAEIDNVVRAEMFDEEYEYEGGVRLKIWGGLPSKKEAKGYWLTMCGMNAFLKGKNVDKDKDKEVEKTGFASVVEEIGVNIDRDRWAGGDENAMYRIRRVFMNPGYKIVAYAYFTGEVDVPFGSVDIPFGGRGGMSRVKVSCGENIVRCWIERKGNLAYLGSPHYMNWKGLPLPDGDVVAASVGKPIPYRMLAPGINPEKSTGIVRHLAPQGSVYVWKIPPEGEVRNMPMFWGGMEDGDR